MSVGTHNESTRTHWLERTLGQIPAGLRILDAGAGEQQYKKFCSHLRYVSQDFGKYDGLGNGAGMQSGVWNQSNLDIISDITTIPEGDSSFDAIMCVEVLEHLPGPELAIKEFARLLKKDGYLVITAPFCSLTHFAPYHFADGFNRYYYETILPRYHFRITEIEQNGNFFEYLAQELRRTPHIAWSYCHELPNENENHSINNILEMLQRFSAKDGGSKDLLCFGFHILARKC